MVEQEKKRFPHDAQLRNFTKELYDTIVFGLSKMIQWLLPKPVGKHP